MLQGKLGVKAEKKALINLKPWCHSTGLYMYRGIPDGFAPSHTASDKCLASFDEKVL
jgi:hypothetical protein